MAKYQCRNGHSWSGVSSLSPKFNPGMLICPKCGTPNESGMERHARQNASQRSGLRDVSDAELAARKEFSRLVREWPCWAKKHRPCEGCNGQGFYAGTGEACATCNGDGKHHCRGPKNAHHLVPVDWMRSTYKAPLGEADFLEIAFAPILGAPACQHNFHARLESRADVIAWHELDPELIEFCKRIDAKHPDLPSMLERLREESPVRVERQAA